MGFSSVTNSAIHSGQGMGIITRSSNNVFLKDNIVFGFRQAGVWFDASNNITFDGNFVGHIEERPTFQAGDNQVDFMAGVSVCTLYQKTKCLSMVIKNNVVAGAPWAGMTLPGTNCGD